MKKKTCNLSTIVCVSLFFLSLTITAYASDASQSLVADGRALLFKNGNPTYSGILEANAKFEEALDQTTGDPNDPAANLFYAVTRIMVFGLEQGNSTELETLRELFEAFGISRNNVDLVEADAPFNDPPEIYDHYNPPEMIPDGENVRAFLTGPFLTLLDAAIININVIQNTSFKITLLASEINDDNDVEVDYGDVLLFRSALYTLKSAILIVTAYNLDIDIRELLVLENADVLQIQRDIMDKYSDFLDLRPADGVNSLADAKQALLNGINAYKDAFNFIKTESDPQENDLFYFESGEEQRKAEFVLTQLTELKNSLNENRPAEFTTIDETWIFIDTTTNDQLEIEIEKDVNEKFVIGDYWGQNGCDFISCSGWVESFSISETSVTIEVAYDGMYSGSATFTGIINIEGTSISGTYTEYDDFGIVKGSGFFTATRQNKETETETIDFNCIFGNTNKSPLDIRAILPEFDQYDEPVPGTFLPINDSFFVLNGILPEFTTNDDLTMEMELQPSGFFNIPTATINIDGVFTDWNSDALVFTDINGDEDVNFQGMDLKDFYMAQDTEYYYFRMTFYDGMGTISGGASPTYHFKAGSDYDSWLAGDRFCGVDPVNLNVWVMETSGTEEPVNLNISYTDFAAKGTDSIEWKVPKGDIGSLAGKFVDVWTHMIGEPPIWYDASDCNNTGIKLNITSLFGTINPSVNYTSGNIFIYVYDGSNPNTANELGSTYISVSGDYEITGLPKGANVYLFARWDTDDNGTETPGDYLYKTGPITITGDESITANFESSTIIAGSKGEPYFLFCNVQAFNSSTGIKMVLTAKVFDPDGTVPDTINCISVSGPSGFSCSFAAEAYSGRNAYWYGTSDHPYIGEYTFTVIDSDGKTAVSHYYFQGSSNIPLPNTSTIQASGNSLTPTLSWGAVSGYEGNLFYRAGIFEVDGENLIFVWRSSSYFTTNTVMVVPYGILDGTKSYKWGVRAFDNYTYAVSNNRSVSDKVDLTIDNTTPYFTTATVYNCQDSDGQFYTAIKAMVVDPDGTIPNSLQSLTVKNPSGTTIYTFQSEDYDSILQKYYKKISGRPVDGIYEFTVTDINNNTKTTYDYVKVHDVPLVDSSTLHASGNTLTPTLSWGVPTGMDRSLYFRAMVYDNDGNQIWKPERTANTYLDVPSGILQEGVSYLWNVQVFDDKYSVNYSNRSNSSKVELIINDAQPYFKWAAVYKLQTPDGLYTALSAAVVDPNGTVPDSIQSLTVTGPNGFSQDLLEGDYSFSDNNFFLMVSINLAEGVYTFTVKDNEGNISVTHDYVEISADIPMVDETSILVTGNTLSPTISWNSISGYPGHLFYRIRVYDDQFNTVYTSKREPFTAQKIPEGKLEVGKSYFVRVDAHDHRDWVIYDSRSNSSKVTWTPDIDFSLEIGGSVSGHVYEENGETPIYNVHVYACDYNTDEWVGGTNTRQDGSYTLVLPTGTYRVRACASCSELNYIDEYYDNTGIWDQSTEVPVTSPDITSGIDFILSLILPPHKKGDLNDDNNVNLSDAILALKVVVRLSPTEINLNADINGDGKIGLFEVVYILQDVAGLR